VGKPVRVKKHFAAHSNGKKNRREESSVMDVSLKGLVALRRARKKIEEADGRPEIT